MFAFQSFQHCNVLKYEVIAMGKKLKRDNSGVRNPVARHAGKFNRSTVFKDRTRYRRTDKHQGLKPFASFIAL